MQGGFDLFIRRPVFATVLSLIVVLLGIVSYNRLSVREYPNIDEPVVSVRTDYPGASAEIMETQVTQILENSIAGIAGIQTISSSSQQERSQISIVFEPTVDPDVAASDVRDRVGRVRGRLPEAVEEPVIAKVEADARPMLFLALTSDRLSPLEITDIARRIVAARLQNSPGVAEVRIFGERRYAMRIWLDRIRLAAYDLTVQDVEQALREQNIEIPAGRIESDTREFTLLSQTGLTAPEEFGAVVLKNVNGALVRLRDVARVEIGAADERRASWVNGQPSITLGIVKQATANPLDVSAGIRERLPRTVADLPDGMNLQVAYDTAVFIDRSIRAVYMTIAEAIILVTLVIFLFLRSGRATLIPLVTIPVSLIGAFGLMYLFGFSINTLTLLAMVLAIGLVVDDAIVVLENIHRHVERGLAPLKAAAKGITEIAFAVVAMTLTLAAVYAPMVFATGRTGKLFIEFALTLAGAVVISGFVALTLSPMMCSRMLKPHERHGRVYNWLERGFRGLSEGYRRALAAAMTMRPAVVAGALAVAAVGVVTFLNLKSELAPIEDRGNILVVGTTPEGSTLDYSARYARQMEQFFDRIPEVDRYLVIAGFPNVTDVLAFARLVDWEERSVSQQEIVALMMRDLSSIAGARVFAINPASLGQTGRTKPVSFVLQTTESYDQLAAHVDVFMREVQGHPALVGLESDLNLNKPQIRISLDREKIADLGLKVSEVGRTLETLLGGRQVTRFNQHGEQYDVIIQVTAGERATPADLASIYVRSARGEMIQLANIMTLVETVAPKELNRFNQLRAATVSGFTGPGHSLGEALVALEEAAERVLPASVLTDYSGISREFRESSYALYFVFLLALCFIYLVLAAQFESWVDPAVIMFSVPLSITGAVLALYLSGGTLNVYSQIGLVTLIGLITKHGILIVEFSNQLQAQGRPRREAVLEAAALRLRPILMTTGAMVLGAVPLALAHGAGAESRHEIGWVIVGGMTVGTLFTLFVVPVAYSYLARDRAARPDMDAVAGETDLRQAAE